MTDNTEHHAFANAVQSEPDALAEVIEELVYNSAMAIAQGHATPETLKASLTDQGISPQQTEYIVDLATTMARNAIEQAKKLQKLSQPEEPWYLREHRRQHNATFDRDVMRAGGLILVLAVIFLAVFGSHVHGRGQGMLTMLILVGIGAIAYGFWGRIQAAFNRPRDR